MRKDIEVEIADSHRFVNHRPEITEKFQVILNTCRKNFDIDARTREHFNIKKHTIIPLDKNAKKRPQLPLCQMIIFTIANLVF